MKSRNHIGSNIWKLYLLEAAYEGMFIIPVLIPFFQLSHITLKEVFWLQSVFAVTAFLADIPTGYVADRWGRKNTLVLGGLFGLIAIVTYALGTGFWWFFWGEIFMALLVSFHSGTVEALLYDTLLDIGDEKKYRRLSGSMGFWAFISRAVTSVIGGLIAVYSLRAAAWATAAIFVIGFLATISLREVRRHKIHDEKHLGVIWRVSSSTLFHNVPLRSVVFLYAVFSTLTLTLIWYTQPYQTMIGLPLVWFGIAHAVIMLGGALGSKIAHSAERLMDDRILLIILAALVAASYVGLGLMTSWWGLAFLFVGRIAWGMFSPVIHDLVNRMTSSDVRATVLSVMSSFGRLIGAVVLFLVGYSMDAFTLNQSILLTGAVGAVGLVILFLLMRNVWGKIPS